MRTTQPALWGRSFNPPLAVCPRQLRLRIGLFGGTFFPAHRGHRQIAETTRKRLKLHQMWWLLSPPHILKPATSLPNDTHRHNSIKSLHLPRWRHYVLSPADTPDRMGFSAHQTVCRIKNAFPGCRFIWTCGSDSFASVPHWRQPRAMMRQTPFAVSRRPGARLPRTWRHWPLRFTVTMVTTRWSTDSSTALRTHTLED